MFLHSAYNVKMDTAKIRVILKFVFRRGTNATESARNANAMFGD